MILNLLKEYQLNSENLESANKEIFFINKNLQTKHESFK